MTIAISIAPDPGRGGFGKAMTWPKERPMYSFRVCNFTKMTAASFALLVLLAACNTTAGAGKDISAAGHAITKSADQHSN